MALLDSFWGTERGLSASSDSRAEINELLTQASRRVPHPPPLHAHLAAARPPAALLLPWQPALNNSTSWILAHLCTAQLEARNPTPEPNDARAVLGGTWRLAYTSNSELIALLALSRLPLVSVGDITQEIDPLGQTVENRVELTAPLRWESKKRRCRGRRWWGTWSATGAAPPRLRRRSLPRSVGDGRQQPVGPLT